MSFLLAFLLAANPPCPERVGILHEIEMYEKLHREISERKDWADAEDLEDLERRIRFLKAKLEVLDVDET